jgi:hypothetical protein
MKNQNTIIHVTSIYIIVSTLFFSPTHADVFDTELAVNETPIITNEELPQNWAVASDPELVKFGDQWFMFFNSIQLDFKKGLPIHVLAASLPKGETLSANRKKWTVHPYPVISPGEKGSWDSHTIETTKYVYGYDVTARKWVGRLYYVGWPAQKNKQKAYQISFVQWHEQQRKWLKYGKPVISATEPWEKLNGSSFIGDPSAYYEPGKTQNSENGTWHIWYQAVSKQKDGGISLAHITSKDGINWSHKNRMTHKVPFNTQFVKTGPFSVDVFVKDGYFYFSGFLYNHQDLSKQGLWITRSTTPDGSAPEDFNTWHPLIFENNGVKWHDSGLISSKCHVTGLFAPSLREDNGKVWVFYHGYFRTGKIKNPCTDHSKNSGTIGRAEIKNFDKIAW